MTDANEGMIYEDEVVDAVRDHLSRNGWTVMEYRYVNEPGEDVVAVLGGRKLVVEAKGETSSSETTSRYGAPFSGKQVFSHVSKAVLKAVRAYSQGAEPGMAFPETRLHHKEVALIEPALAALGVTVFWVDRDRTVTECDYRVAKSYEA